ncbi:MAG: mechanosensitive ion channel family protein [Alistipes sp.]|jgi:small-conductance mechanosensitive channel|nr:mechanosensitive ion channel family protein [Alistipes sp.]
MNLSWEILMGHLPKVYVTLGAWTALWLLKFVIRKTARKVGAMMGKPRERVRYIRKVIGGILNVTFVICIAMYWGVRPQNLAIALSSVLAFVGVAMFAQWSMVSSITAGVIMFFSAPFHVGNRIRIIDKDYPLEATIEHIGAFYTHLRTPEGELVTIPNNVFLQKVVGVR